MIGLANFLPSLAIFTSSHMYGERCFKHGNYSYNRPVHMNERVTDFAKLRDQNAFICFAQTHIFEAISWYCT